MRKPTIFEVLTDRLGRAPTSAECRDECKRIISEAYVDLATKGKLQHQRR